MFFHVKGKGNEKVNSLTQGQRVSYTEMTNDKGVCAENVKPIKGVCACVCARVHVSSRRNGDGKSKRMRETTHT